MPLSITKIAFRAESADTLRAWLESHRDVGEAPMTTRYLPKRVEEMAGGSLYWILGHQIIGRSPILGFTEAAEGRHRIRLEPRLIPVQPRPKRAHQGWRYLEERDAPPDLADGAEGADTMPAAMVGELSKLGLL
ncbi:MAG: DUF1489 domain-containing protein [Sphingobium sp.]|nr:MAG: DUF1489 domain-containing protein [Sphingobium sp.]